ncbi:hypothetical protein VOF77_22980 [Leclercia adecarboxylata]|uniref:hypothetical protein n=1 Tax=Leclercia adecarboxylata TaxID=83655 RepID=UPI002DB7BD79|nr:hypothetical protein [Leclercia adecarboxylata]MEC3905148.1 hypothetical protein [Leclercia adecarboxylata]
MSSKFSHALGKHIRWFFIERWLIKHAVRDWMLADAGKYEQRKQYYFARMSEDYCGIRGNALIRRDLQVILQLRGKVDA